LPKKSNKNNSQPDSVPFQIDFTRRTLKELIPVS